MTVHLDMLHQAKSAARVGYAWPGGYELFACMNDGGAICTTCIKAEWRNIVSSHLLDIHDGWLVAAVESTASIDGPLSCSHCSKELMGEET